MCPTYGAVSPASLPTYSENCPLTEKAALPKKGFSGDLNLNSILEADKLGWLENASLTPFHLLVGGPTPPSASFSLAPLLGCWLEE